MSKKLIVLISLLMGILGYFFSGALIKFLSPNEEPATEEDFEELYKIAETFDEQYRYGVSDKSLELTDDYIEEDNQFKVLFENEKCYIILNYDQNKKFLGGRMASKVNNAISNEALKVFGGILAFFMFFIYFVKIANSDDDKNEQINKNNNNL